MRKKYHGPKEQLEDARLPNTTADVLDVLAESVYEFVQAAVAEHPNTRPRTLAELVPFGIEAASDQYLAASLAWNKNTPDYALRRLGERMIARLDSGRGQQKYFEIGVALSCNPNTPSDIIEGLLAPEYTATEFRKVVARETRRQDVLQLLQTDKSETVRKQASKTAHQMVESSPGDHPRT